MKESGFKKEQENFIELETEAGLLRVRRVDYTFETQKGSQTVTPSSLFVFEGETYYYYGLDEDGKPVVFRKKREVDKGTVSGEEEQIPEFTDIENRRLPFERPKSIEGWWNVYYNRLRSRVESFGPEWKSVMPQFQDVTALMPAQARLNWDKIEAVCAAIFGKNNLEPVFLPTLDVVFSRDIYLQVMYPEKQRAEDSSMGVLSYRIKDNWNIETQNALTKNVKEINSKKRLILAESISSEVLRSSADPLRPYLMAEYGKPSRSMLTLSQIEIVLTSLCLTLGKELDKLEKDTRCRIEVGVDLVPHPVYNMQTTLVHPENTDTAIRTGTYLDAGSQTALGGGSSGGASSVFPMTPRTLSSFRTAVYLTFTPLPAAQQ